MDTLYSESITSKHFLSFIYALLAVLGLHRCSQAFSSCGEQGLLFTAVRELLMVVACAVADHTGFSSCRTWTPRLESTDSIVTAQGLSSSEPCGIFLDQELNPCLLHWQADSLPLSHHKNLIII